MNDSVNWEQINFTIYGSLGIFNTTLLLCIFFLYIVSLCINLFLVLVICTEARLYSRPMYMLLVNLCLSGVVGSSLMCPNIIHHLLHHGQPVFLQGCLTQAFFTNIYSGSIFCNLALMAYDRYVSICKPLLYHSIMTPGRVGLMLLVVYVVLSCSSGVQVNLITRLQLCGNKVNKLICDSLVVSNLSCRRTTVISVYGLCCAVGFIMLPCGLVILSYVHIFSVVLKKSRHSQSRALQTCTPHLVTFVNFSVASFFGVIYNRLSSDLPIVVNIVVSINFFVIPPLLHPIIYGIKMKAIRQSMKQMKNLLFCSRSHLNADNLQITVLD
ncbi:olfactory receptor 10J5-like [Cynoglossus semilaevis]|uniref:olfactory receptor 10J5-like n=1 Tax=Cynoglossus semilaevis TaxID=244447 RepID=UPI000496748D|nr:olfactory receptor 10J5-like [Cynoglossus semilaevis]